MITIKMNEEQNKKKQQKKKTHNNTYSIDMGEVLSFFFFFSNRGGKSIITQLDFSHKLIFLVMSPGDRLKQCQLYYAFL